MVSYCLSVGWFLPATGPRHAWAFIESDFCGSCLLGVRPRCVTGEMIIPESAAVHNWRCPASQTRHIVSAAVRLVCASHGERWPVNWKSFVQERRLLRGLLRRARCGLLCSAAYQIHYELHAGAWCWPDAPVVIGEEMVWGWEGAVWARGLRASSSSSVLPLGRVPLIGFDSTQREQSTVRNRSGEEHRTVTPGNPR